MAYQSELDKLKSRFEEKPEQWFAALADQHRKLGELDEAIRIVREGIELRPNYVSGHIVHGRCLVDQGEDAEAKAVFEQVLEFDAENIIALRMLGEISERSGDMEEAQRWLGRLLDVDPMNEEARELLARVEAGGVGVDGDEEAPVDFAGAPDLPTETEPDADDEADAPEAAAPAAAGLTDPEGPTVEMAPPESALHEDGALAEPTTPEVQAFEPDAPEAVAESEFESEPEVVESAADAPVAVTDDEPFDPAEPEPDAEEPESVAAEPDDGFIIRQQDPFGVAQPEEEEEAPASFDDVMPDSDGGVFGVTEIDFESDKWKQGPRESGVDLPTGGQEVSLDNLPTPTGESDLPVGDQSISLDDIHSGSSGESDLPAGDREISLDDLTPVGAGDSDLPDGEREITFDDLPSAASAESAPEAATPDEVEEGEVTQPVAAVDAEALRAGTVDEDETEVVDVMSPDDVADEPLVAEVTSSSEEPAAEEEMAAAPEEDDEPDGPTVVMSPPDLAAVAEAGARRPDPAPETDDAGADMVTETLAEVYMTQGLFSKAREVYEQLIEANPGDSALKEKLAALNEREAEEAAQPTEAPPAHSEPAPDPEPAGVGPGDPYLAEETGGTTVRAFLANILASRPGEVEVADADTEPVAVATAPPEPTPLEKAFGHGDDADPEEEGESPLAAVFEGDEPEAAADPAPEETDEAMSFDQFFNTDTEESAQPDDTGEKSEDDEDFKNWLQGLKS